MRVASFFIVLVTLSTLAHAEFQITRLVGSGDPAPGRDLPFTNFQGPNRLAFRMNPSGQVVFSVPGGIWTGVPGHLQNVVLSNTPAPGTEDGTKFFSFSSVAIAGNGNIAFTGYLRGSGFILTSSRANGVWFTDGSETNLVIRGEQELQGTNGLKFSRTVPSVVDDYQPQAISTFVSDDGHVLLNNVQTSPTPYTSIGWRDGNIVPALPGPQRQVFPAVMSSRGLVAITAEAYGSSGLYALSGSADNLEPIPFIFGSYLSGAQLAFSTINNNGQIIGAAYMYELTGFLTKAAAQNVRNDLYFGVPGEVRPILKVGQFVSETERFGRLELRTSISLSDSNCVALRSQLFADRRGIIAGTVDDLNLVVATGTPAPFTEDGTLIADLFPRLSQLPMNELGQIAFPARLAGPAITDANDLAIYATDLLGQLQLIAREGFSLDGRIIAELNPIVSEFADTSQFAFSATFTDGSSGIYIATVPEPAFTTIVLVATASCIGIRRNRPTH